MHYDGYIADSMGRRLRGTFGAIDAAGQPLFGPTDTDEDGSFGLSINPGESVWFSAPGYATKMFPFDAFSGGVVVLNKPVPLAAIAAVVGIAYVMAGGKKIKGIGKLNFDFNDVKTIFWIIGGVLSLDIITRILRGLGFWKDPISAALDAESSNPNSFFNPNFWRQSQNYTYAITTPMAEDYARQIYDSLGWFNDDESAITSVFHQLRTQANFSYLAFVFQQKYGKDLFTTLRGSNWPQDGISDADLNSIIAYGRSLPKF